MPWFAGVPRSEIDWGPTVDAKKCVGCGVCLNCGKNVFEWKDGKSVVARRDDCQVGCTTCANLCQGRCISFPTLEDLRRFYKDQRVWNQVKKSMIAEGKIPAGKNSAKEVED
jgi:NAD-dependent dihydropyrimidine dehydrogenase PreA subunit